MDKAGLLDLIARINTREENIKISSETTGWKALREAETLEDPALFPLLREIVAENEGKAKAKRDVRSAAYFIYGRLMERAFSPGDCDFLLRRLEKETDKYLLHSMLDRIQDWQGRQGILMPPELDTSPVARLTEDDRWLVRHAAIHALGRGAGRPCASGWPRRTKRPASTRCGMPPSPCSRLESRRTSPCWSGF